MGPEIWLGRKSRSIRDYFPIVKMEHSKNKNISTIRTVAICEAASCLAYRRRMI